MKAQKTHPVFPIRLATVVINVRCKIRRAQTLLTSLVAALVIGLSAPAIRAQSNPAAVPGELVVQFKTSATDVDLHDALMRAAMTIKDYAPARGRNAKQSGLLLMRTSMSTDKALAMLRGQLAVEYAEPNVTYHVNATSNDPQFTSGKLWGMYGDASSPVNAYGSQAAEAWASGNTGSSSVYVGIIDQGIAIKDPDLVPNVGHNPGETGLDALGRDKATNGLDDDGNGFTDDVYGWDFFHGDNTVYDAGDGDRCKEDHGTHVAGIVGARGGNGIGVAGVCWNVRLLSAKVFGPNGGASFNAARAVRYFIDLKMRHGLNIVAINNSWGGSTYTRVLHEALIDAALAGIITVAGAGNNSANTDLSGNYFYPACYNTAAALPWISASSQPTSYAPYDAVISVAAIDNTGKLARFSNWGAATVDLGAPGVGIISTLPGGRYGSMNGTSMAAPHVTGACALYLGSHPEATAHDTIQAVLDAARQTSTTSLNGKTATGGRLNAGAF